MKASPSISMISSEIIAGCECFFAARSPARPWINTPVIAATSGLYPWARNDVMIPVRTSPLPAVAIPGFPVELKNILPSAFAIAEYAPFKTILQLYFMDKSLSLPRRSY